MPCQMLIHITGRGSVSNGDWDLGDIIVAMQPDHKWGKKDKRMFLPVLWPHCNHDEAVTEHQGRDTATADWEKWFDKDWEKAAVRNPDVLSPTPHVNLIKAEHIKKKP